MASFSTSIDDGNFQFQFTEPNLNISEHAQTFGNKREDNVYEEPTNLQQDEQFSGNNRQDNAYDESALIRQDEQISGNNPEDNFYDDSANNEQNEQISGSKYVYEEPAITQRSSGRKEDKELQANNWPMKCFMTMMSALVIAVVVLTVSTISNYGIKEGINQVVWNFEQPFSEIHDGKFDHYWTVFLKHTLIIFDGV